MKLSLILLFATALQVSANGYAQSISLSMKDAPLEKVFREIRKQSGFNFLYSYEDISRAKPVSLQVKSATLEQVLMACFQDQPLNYRIVDSVVVVRKISTPGTSLINPELPPSFELKGNVTSEKGDALEGISVTVKGRSGGTLTGANGEFTLPNIEENSILVFSGVNIESQEVKVSGSAFLNIVVKQKISQLSETVVTALGIKRGKRDLTYSTQEIKSSELMQAKEPNLLNAISGKVSGAQVTSSSGAPGSSTRIVIRGATSVLGNNEALIVVDGVPINNSETGAVSPGAGSSRIIDIDPATIENINVLKGAAATALYGSSGARGVVIITTKGGSIDKKPLLSFTTEASVDKGIFPEFQHKYGQGINGVFINGNTVKSSAAWGPLMDTLKIDGKPAPVYDPVDMFFQTGFSLNNSLAVSGGNKNSAYYMSYSNFYQEGIVPTTNFKRNSFFVKYSNKITDKLTSTFQLTYTNSKQQRTPEGVTFGQPGPIFVTYNQPISWNPQPIYSADGKQRVFRTGRNNPYWDLENVYNKYNVNRFIPVISFNYQINKWLSLSERLGADIFAEQDNYKSSPSTALNTSGRLVENNINYRQFNSDLILSANKQFGDFNVNILFGNNILSTYSQRVNVEGVGLTVNDYDNMAGASTITASEKHYLQRKVGFYTQANISFREFLVLSATGRYDGSSVLSSENAFYPYGSVAGSFIFSRFLPTSLSDAIPFGKLRVSFATVGNDNVGVYSLNTPYVSAVIDNINFPYQGQAGFLRSQVLGNANLKNERLNEFEIGLETRLFRNRVGFEASYFNRKSIDGIIPGVSISSATGFNGTTVNSAQISNKGFELLLNLSPVKTKNFNWNITGSFTKIKNEVLALYGDLNSLGRIIVGQPYNIFYGSRFDRTADGQVLVDEDGLPVLDDTPGIIGDANPDWLAGITNSFQYKQFSFSFFFDIKKGGDMYNSTELNNYFFGTAKSTEDRRPIVYKGISVTDGKPNTVEVSAQELYRYYSDIDEPAMQDGSYIKLRNVSLAYSFEKRTLSKTPFKAASITLTGKNLWIYAPHFTSGDPEGSTNGSSNESQGYYGYAYPSTRSLNISLKFDF